MLSATMYHVVRDHVPHFFLHMYVVRKKIAYDKICLNEMGGKTLAPWDFTPKLGEDSDPNTIFHRESVGF